MMDQLMYAIINCPVVMDQLMYAIISCPIMMEQLMYANINILSYWRPAVNHDAARIQKKKKLCMPHLLPRPLPFRSFHFSFIQLLLGSSAAYLSHLATVHTPAYLSHLATVHTHAKQPPSFADTGILCIPHATTKTSGQSSFSYCTPKQWNSLPADILHIQSSHAFKTALKNHLSKVISKLI